MNEAQLCVLCASFFTSAQYRALSKIVLKLLIWIKSFNRLKDSLEGTDILV